MTLRGTFDTLGITGELFENCHNWAPTKNKLSPQRYAAKRWRFDTAAFRNKIFMEDEQIQQQRIKLQALAKRKLAMLSQKANSKTANGVVGVWMWNFHSDRFRHIKNFSKM